MPYADITVRLRAQRHYIRDQEPLGLSITGNGAWGTTVSVFQEDFQPPRPGANALSKLIGVVDRAEWYDFMRQIAQQGRGHQGGPRVGQGALPWISEAVALDRWDMPLPNGGFHDAILVRLYF